VMREQTPALELGCGTGRLLAPLARAGATMFGVDFSTAMIARGRARVRRLPAASRPAIVRGDIRALPFPSNQFSLVAAPYGVLQSLLREADLSATLRAVHDVLTPGGRLVIELVADLASWQEYRGQTRLRGWRPGRKTHLTLVESVRQDRRKGLTLFEQEFVERRGDATVRKRFSLAFRTLSVPQMTRRLEKAGLRVTSRLGSYDGAPWSPEAETWILVAERAAC